MTIGTFFHTLLRGKQIGVDEYGNRYFEAKSGKDTLHGRRRRWVVYKMEPEASRVPAEWHAWLHHTFEEPLTTEAAASKKWQKPHQENKTGTAEAYRPKGHAFNWTGKLQIKKVYSPWKPE